MGIPLPQVSIIMATFNRAHLIKESLECILNQSFIDWELLIIDDGSTDCTVEVLDEYSKRDSRIRFYSRSKSHLKGLPGCRNMGLEKAKGDYIVFFDDDDIPHPDLLKLAVKEIKNNKADYCRYLRAAFTGNFNYNFDRSSGYNVLNLDITHLDKIITNVIPFNSCQVLWDKECFRNRKFAENLMYAEEWELYSRILSTGLKGISIEKVLFFGRKHPASNTGEFYNDDPIRKKSKILAIEMVLKNLVQRNLLSDHLIHYFLRIGFFINSREVILKTLQFSNADAWKIMYFKLAYKIYPMLRPFLILKGRITNKR
jgi:GalNAc5-diNAcBac-PP-undecaprenol beta-1,3-glucosyltransferase